MTDETNQEDNAKFEAELKKLYGNLKGFRLSGSGGTCRADIPGVRI